VQSRSFAVGHVNPQALVAIEDACSPIQVLRLSFFVSEDEKLACLMLRMEAVAARCRRIPRLEYRHVDFEHLKYFSAKLLDNDKKRTITLFNTASIGSTAQLTTRTSPFKISF